MFCSYQLNSEKQTKFEYAAKTRCVPATARCCSSRGRSTMRVLGLSGHHGAAELLGWEETDQPRETRQGKRLRACNGYATHLFDITTSCLSIDTYVS